MLAIKVLHCFPQKR